MSRSASKVLAAAFGAAIVLATACGGSDAADGESCEDSSDCKSNVCESGTCGGSQCSCAGDTCDEATECLAGWECKRGSTGADNAFPRCKKTCATTADCQANHRCVFGFCEDGADNVASPALSWDPDLDSRRCFAGAECQFGVAVSGGSGTIERYEWLFGVDATADADAGTLATVTTEPKVSRRISVGGSFAIKVTAFDANGTQASLIGDQTVCIPARSSISCTPGLSDQCCSGICQATTTQGKGICP